MTWSCPKCGAIFLSEAEKFQHMRSSHEAKYQSNCIYCHGKGLIIPVIGPAYKCPHCGGIGKA